MSCSFLLRSHDIREIVVHLRCNATALAATLAECGPLCAVDGRPGVVRGDLPPFIVVVDAGNDLSSVSTSTVLANSSSWNSCTTAPMQHHQRSFVVSELCNSSSSTSLLSSTTSGRQHLTNRVLATAQLHWPRLGLADPKSNSHLSHLSTRMYQRSVLVHTVCSLTSASTTVRSSGMLSLSLAVSRM